MGKKRVIDFEIIALFALFFLFVFFSVFFSSAQELQKKYLVGETIKLNLPGNSNIKIITPSESYIQKASGDFFFYLDKVGEYSLEVSYGKKKEIYAFFVVDKIVEEQKQSLENISENSFLQEEETNKTTKVVSFNYPNSSERRNKTLPEVKERQISKAKKEIKIDCEEYYENITLSSEINESLLSHWDKDKIKIYSKEESKYVDFQVKDANENGLIDGIQWVVSNFSSQTFEVIIEISKAEYLNSEKNFIEDIYEQVKALDGLWSPVIGENEYVRITFEKFLTKENDITVYPRVLSGNPTIEVYEIDSSEKIAEFSPLISNTYNKVYLTNLIGEQNSFDLRIVGGSVEFEHIVDPNLYIRSGTDSYTAGTPRSITFTTAMPDTSYSILFSGQQDTDEVFSIEWAGKSTGGFVMQEIQNNGGTNNSAGFEWAALSYGEYTFGNLLIKCGSGAGTSTATTSFTSSFPDTSYAVVSFPTYDSDSPRVSYSAKTSSNWSSVILDDGGAAEAVTSIDWCAISYGTSTFQGATIKAGYNTTSGATSKIISLGSAFPNTNYVVLTTAIRTAGDPCEIEVSGKTTTTFSITAQDDDNTNNCDGREFNWIAISSGEKLIDLTPPTFSSIPKNSSIWYKNESLGVDFDATDDIAFSSFSVNDTKFKINSTGFLSNATILAVENYLLNVTINDTAGNVNSTLYFVQVNKSAEDFSIYFNETSPIYHPYSFRVWSDCITAFTLYRNGTEVSNNSQQNLAVGTYNFTSIRTDQQNYSFIYNEENFEIIQDLVSPRVYFPFYENETLKKNTESFSLNIFVSDLESGLIGSTCFVNANGTNQTLVVSNGWCNFSEIYLTNLQDGQNTIYAYANDTSNNFGFNDSYVIKIDSTSPFVDFGFSTPKNNSKFARDWIYIDASIIEENEQNITFSLYNSTGLINSTTYTDMTREINWSGLIEGVYLYNITVFDKLNQSNFTSTRNIILNFTIPTIIFVPLTEEHGTSFSKNWIYVNTSVENANNEINITFRLFNDSGIVNSTTYTDMKRDINWTELAEGNYYYNAILFDELEGEFSTFTRQISLDSTPPNASLVSPENFTYTNISEQNLTVEAFDNLQLSNLTLFVYNSSQTLINETLQNISGTEAITGIIYSFPYDGVFSWFYKVADLVGKYSFTENNTVIIDTITPLISYAETQDVNEANVSRNWIFVNLSIAETNFANVTYNLYNLSGNSLLNSTTFFSNQTMLNFTNLPNGKYSYNVTIIDKANQENSTETRNITLDTEVFFTLFSPQNKTYTSVENIPIEFYVEDELADFCWYSFDQISNITIDCYENITFNAGSEGFHNFTFFVNDTFGNLESKMIYFTINSTFSQYTGILAYGTGTSPVPRYRVWNGSGFGEELSASTATTGVIEWVIAKSSPSRDEFIIATTNTSDSIFVQVYSDSVNDFNGTSCWHDGVSCGSVLKLTQTSTALNFQKVAVAYETISEDALIVYSDGTATPKYRTWNGSSFSNEISISQTLLSRTVNFVRMASHPFSDEIALVMLDQDATSANSELNSMIWNGTGWECERTALITTLNPNTYQQADLAYEQLSGDLFIAASVNAISEFDFITKPNGVCTYTTTRTSTIVEEVEEISVASKVKSDFILISGHDIGSEDMHAIAWNGTTIMNISIDETTLLADTAPNLQIASVWNGMSDIGLVVYSDNGGTTADYLQYNSSSNYWVPVYGTTNEGLSSTGISMTYSERNIKAYSFPDMNKSLIILEETSSLDLFAKQYNADSNSWSNADGGSALNLQISTSSFPAFDFDFRTDLAGPSMIVRSPSLYSTDTSVWFNVTPLESTDNCSLSLDYLNYELMGRSLVNPKDFVLNKNVSDGNYTATFLCADYRGNSRMINRSFTVDSTPPVISLPFYVNATAKKNTDFLTLNVSIFDAGVGLTGSICSINLNGTNQTFLVLDGWCNTTNIALTNLEDGNKTISIYVNDTLNNIALNDSYVVLVDTTFPIVLLNYPENTSNFTGSQVDRFGFSVFDANLILNCSLYGNFGGVWNINQTISLPENDADLVQNFSEMDTMADGYYVWNVLCVDAANNEGWNSTNFSFSTFFPPQEVINLSISQTKNDGSGDVFLFWNESLHSDYYVIYSTPSLKNEFIFLNKTKELSYTDITSSEDKRRFYKVSNWNPVGENISSIILGKTIYNLNKNTQNTRNWIGFYLSNQTLTSAFSMLNEITNITTINMFNSTIQRRVTCNSFSCPDPPSCTETNCNFKLSDGFGYEVNLNSSAQDSVNWSTVGILKSPILINLTKNSTDFGKNWISIYGNTSLVNAQDLILNISGSDAVTSWYSQLQSSKGLIFSPFSWVSYVGTNFYIEPEGGYEVSVNVSGEWVQK